LRRSQRASLGSSEDKGGEEKKSAIRGEDERPHLVSRCLKEGGRKESPTPVKGRKKGKRKGALSHSLAGKKRYHCKPDKGDTGRGRSSRAFSEEGKREKGTLISQTCSGGISANESTFVWILGG